MQGEIDVGPLGDCQGRRKGGVETRNWGSVLTIMSQKPGLLNSASRLPSNSHHLPGRRKPTARFASLGLPANRNASSTGPSLSRRASVAGLTSGPKSQRSSKTTHKLVVLPSAPQTRPFLTDVEDDLTLGPETDGGVREYKSQAERMSKLQRKEAGYKRITAYCVAESFKMKLLSSFLKREHNVSPRAFDEALYVVSSPVIVVKTEIKAMNSYRCTIYLCFLDMAPTPMYDPPRRL